MTNLVFGARPPKTDLRDYKIKAKVAEVIDVKKFELEDLPLVKNQRSICSCTAHSSSSILEWFNNKEIKKYRELSTGFIYGMQGIEFDDMGKGMHLRDACKIVQKYGDCLVETVPYNIEMPECCNRLKAELNEDIYKESAIHKVESYAKCETEETIKYALMNYSPVLMSVRWYSKYNMSDNNIIEFDTTSKKGCHAIMVYGFNEDGWLCQNSWGDKWGNNGRFILPYKYGFIEAWSFVDARNSDIHRPKRNFILDFIYKIFNYIINLFEKIKKDNY